MSDQKLFVSYSTRDRQKVIAVVDCLKEHGFDLWFDQNAISAAKDTVREIESGLKGCSHFLLFASKAYFESEWATAEYRAALYAALNAEGVTIIIVKLDDVTLPVLISPLRYISYTTDAEVGDILAGAIRSSSNTFSASQSVNKPLQTDRLFWESMHEHMLRILLDSLLNDLGRLRRQDQDQITLKTKITEHNFVEMKLIKSLLNDEVLMADLHSEWEIYKIHKKTIASYMKRLSSGGLGIFEPAFEIELEKRQTQLSESRARLVSQLSFIAPLVWYNYLS